MVLLLDPVGYLCNSVVDDPLMRSWDHTAVSASKALDSGLPAEDNPSTLQPDQLPQTATS
jgi:hypothetical protein